MSFNINDIVKEQLIINGTIKSDVTYKIGPFLNRISKVTKNSKNRSKHLFIAGGSNAFGQWLEDDETIAYQSEMLLPNHRAYSFSSHGYSATNLIKMFETLTFPKSVLNKQEGSFIYLLYDFHISRINCLSSQLAWSRGLSPYFETNNHGIVVNKGLCKDQFKSKLKLFMIDTFTFIHKHIYSFKKGSYVSLIKKKHIIFSVKVIKELKKKYLDRFPKGNFKLFLPPQALNISKEFISIFLKELKKESISVIDRNQERLEHNHKYYNPYDHHITPLATKLYAKYITESTNSNESKK
jgi:hypothetical protein